MSRKGGTRGGGLVHPEGENNLAMSGLDCENPFSPILGANRPRKQFFYPIGPPYSVQGYGVGLGKPICKEFVYKEVLA